MRLINLQGLSREEIIKQLSKYTSNLEGRIGQIYNGMEHHNKREIWDYQACLLYVCANQFNVAGAQIMEFGTCWGWSAAIIANAAPKAKLVTMTPNVNHAKISTGQLAKYSNVKVLEKSSVDLLDEYNGPELDMLFVDGDHDNIRLDMPWWDWMKIGGLMLHHDYTPKGAPRETPIVYNELNLFWKKLGRGPDVLMIDDKGTGMAGWYRREGE